MALKIKSLISKLLKYRQLDKHLVFFSLVLVLISLQVVVSGQKTWDGGAGTLNWNDGNNWNPNGVPVASDIVVLNTGTTFTISNVPNVTLLKLQVTGSTGITLKPTNANRTITVTSASADAVLVESGSSLMIAGRDAATDRTLTLALSNTANLEASVSGTLGVGLDNNQQNAYGIISKGASAVIRFHSGGRYEHAVNSGTIPASTWHSASTCSITGSTSALPSGLNQSFGNLGINVTSLSSAQTLTLTAPMTLQGNLSLTGTSSSFTLTLNPSDQNFTVNGTTTINSFAILNDNNVSGANRFDGLLTVNANGQFTNTNNPPYEFRGGITNNGTFSAGSGMFSFTTNNQALGGTLSIPSLTITGVTLTSNNSLTAGTSVEGTGSLTLAESSGLTLGGTISVSTLDAEANGCTVTYNGSGQAVKESSYYNLAISAGGSNTLQGNVSVGGTLTLSGGTLNVGSATLALNGPAIAGTPGNLNAGSASSLSFGGSESGISIPSNITSLNNLTVDNTNGITINNNLALASGGVLALNSGLINAGAYTLTLTNPSPSVALLRNTGSYIDFTTGALVRHLAASLSGTGNNYDFPVGESGVHKGLVLRDVNTGSSGPILQVSVSATGASSADATTLSAVDPRYWSVQNLNAGNLASAAVEIFETGLDITKTVGTSALPAGVYSAAGGTASGSSVVSPVLTAPGSYFCIGTKMTSFYSRQSGSLGSGSTWSTVRGGPASSYPPFTGNVINIENGHSISVSEDFTCSSVTFTGASASLDVGTGTTLDITGNLTLLKQSNSSAACSLTGGGTVTCGNLEVGTAANPSPSNFGGNTYSHTFTSSVADLQISGNLSINSYFRLLLYLRNGTFSHESGTITVGGSIATSNSNALNTSTYTMAAGTQDGVLILNGANPFSLTSTSNVNLNGTSSETIYGRAGDQVVYGTTYSNLTLGGSGTKTLGGATVNSTLSLEGTAVASGTPSYGASAAIRYAGTSGQFTGTELPVTFSGTGGLVIDNLSGVALSADLTLNSTLHLTAGEFAVGARSITLQNSDLPIIRIAGNLATNQNSILQFGSSGNIAGAEFTLPDNVFKANPEIKDLTVTRANPLKLGNQMLSIHGILLCNGPLDTNGNITLISDPTGTALVSGAGTGTITGNVTMQRYLQTGFGYKYFSSPFQAATVSEFGDDMNLGAAFTTFYRYDETRSSSGWVNYKTGTNILVPMYGYAVNFGAVHGPNTVDITGAVNNGSLSLTLYNNNRPFTKGFNLVGNPYPSPIDWEAASGWTKNNIDNALYFFKAGNSNQYSGTNSTYINGVSSDGDAGRIIPSMQAFFIHVSDGSYPVSATFGMDNNVRITDKVHTFIKGEVNDEKSLIRISAAFDESKDDHDYFVLYSDEKGGNDFDSRIDALKLFNTDLNVPNLYSLTADGRQLSIDAVYTGENPDLIVPLGLKINRAGTVIFSAEDIEGNFKGRRVFLLDKVKGIEKELKNHEEYSTVLDQGEYLNRFFLNVYASSTGLPDISAVQNEDFTAYCSKGNIIADFKSEYSGPGYLIITNTLGSRMLTFKIPQAGHYEFSHKLKTGIYLLTWQAGGKQVTRKLLIRE